MLKNELENFGILVFWPCYCLQEPKPYSLRVSISIMALGILIGVLSIGYLKEVSYSIVVTLIVYLFGIAVIQFGVRKRYLSTSEDVPILFLDTLFGTFFVLFIDSIFRVLKVY